jgi:NAD(P)-dependent dehydrogenase (short-subunit alcohol dehydrogenase family)
MDKPIPHVIVLGVGGGVGRLCAEALAMHNITATCIGLQEAQALHQPDVVLPITAPRVLDLKLTSVVKTDLNGRPMSGRAYRRKLERQLAKQDRKQKRKSS